MRSFFRKALVCVFATLLVLSILVVMYACSGKQGSASRVVVCNHNYQETVVAPTCTNAGYTLHKCTKCGDSYRDSEVAALGHRAGAEWESNSTEHWHECENGCGERTSVGTHTFDAGVVEAQATCENNGRVVYTCTTCGFQRADVLPATGHNIVGGWYSNQDSHWHACSNNNEEKIDNALHSWDEGHVERAATCENPGVIVYTCTVCGRSRNRDIPRTEHNKSREWEADENIHWHTCQTCGDTFDQASHTYGNATITKEPTCVESGMSVRQCTVCGYILRTQIPALGHEKSLKWYSNNDHHWHKCTHDGCSEKFDYATHTFDVGTIYREATCTSNGLKKYTCSVCGYVYIESIPAIGHDIDTAHWQSNAQGHWHLCENDCGGKFNYADHDYNDLGVCKVCGYEQQ